MRTFKFLLQVLIPVLFFMTAGNDTTVLAQDTSAIGEEKIKARISLDYFSINNSKHQLVVTVKTKVEDRFTNTPGVTVHLYKDLVAPENLLANPVTKNDGHATFILPAAEDTALVHTFIAAIENDSLLQDAEKEITITKARIELTTEEQDSVKTVNVFVSSPDAEGKMQPVAGVPIGIFVKRLFGELPITTEAESTDEEGFVRLEIPPDIPGDKNGEYTIIARVSDHETFGNLEAGKTVAWGIPLALNASTQLQELWLSSANTSEAILIITLVLLFCIFGVVIYIFRQLMSISRLGLKS
jgi:hypothetical protein